MHNRILILIVLNKQKERISDSLSCLAVSFPLQVTMIRHSPDSCFSSALRLNADKTSRKWIEKPHLKNVILVLRSKLTHIKVMIKSFISQETVMIPLFDDLSIF